MYIIYIYVMPSSQSLDFVSNFQQQKNSYVFLSSFIDLCVLNSCLRKNNSFFFVPTLFYFLFLLRQTPNTHKKIARSIKQVNTKTHTNIYKSIKTPKVFRQKQQHKFIDWKYCSLLPTTKIYEYINFRLLLLLHFIFGSILEWCLSRWIFFLSLFLWLWRICASRLVNHFRFDFFCGWKLFDFHFFYYY